MASSLTNPATGRTPSGVARAITGLGTSPSRILNQRECDIILRALELVRAHNHEDATTLAILVERLGETRSLLEATPPLARENQLGNEKRTLDGLVDHLCSLDGLSGDLALPIKATLSRTYLLSKIMFMRAFLNATKALAGKSKEHELLCFELREELAESVYTLLAEELLLALLRKKATSPVIKRRAAHQLIAVWDDAAMEVRDFAPLLESAWHARNRVRAAYGTLLGTTEAIRLVCEDCSPDVLEFFSRQDMSPDESAAFKEFLFNMTSEELETLKREMRTQQRTCASPEWAAGVLGRQIEELEHQSEIDPNALYRSYQRRQLAADFRIMSGAPGPRYTAEAYLMIQRLEEEPTEAFMVAPSNLRAVK